MLVGLPLALITMVTSSYLFFYDGFLIVLFLSFV